MKYCPQCGSPLKDNQHFCNRCGCDIQNFKCGYTQENDYFPQEPKRKRRIWPFVVIAIFVIVVIGSSCFAYYHFFLKGNEQAQSKPSTTQHVAKEEEKPGEHKISNDPKKAEKQRAEEEKAEKADKDNEPHPPKIDVLSKNFEESFMHKNTVNEYMGVRKGMKKEEVEKMYGKGEPLPHIEGMDNDFIRYGNLAIIYNPRTHDNTVWGISVVPDNITEGEFLKRYYAYDHRSGSGDIIYDSNKHNGYSIIVRVKNGKVVLIDCAPEDSGIFVPEH